MPGKTEKLLSLLDGQPVIPVLKIEDVARCRAAGPGAGRAAACR